MAHRSQRQIVLGLLLSLFCSCSSSVADYKSLPCDTLKLQEGDLILRRGLALSSRVVENADRDYAYSHIGVLVLYENAWHVLHCVPGESDETNGEEIIKCDKLSLFLRKDRAEAAAVFRYDTSQMVRSVLAHEALSLLKEKIPFDRSYDISDTTKLYCTEMVQLLYARHQIDLTENRYHQLPPFPQKVIFPSDITDNQNVQLVMYIK